MKMNLNRKETPVSIKLLLLAGLCGVASRGAVGRALQFLDAGQRHRGRAPTQRKLDIVTLASFSFSPLLRTVAFGRQHV